MIMFTEFIVFHIKILEIILDLSSPSYTVFLTWITLCFEGFLFDHHMLSSLLTFGIVQVDFL